MLVEQFYDSGIPRAGCQTGEMNVQSVTRSPWEALQAYLQNTCQWTPGLSEGQSTTAYDPLTWATDSTFRTYVHPWLKTDGCLKK